jgi:signal transduction histidine kinase
MKNKQALTGSIPYERILNFPLYLNNKAYFEDKEVSSSLSKIPSASEQLRRLEIIDELSHQIDQTHTIAEFATLVVGHLQRIYGEPNCFVGMFSEDKMTLNVTEYKDHQLGRRSMKWYLPTDQWICCKMEDFADSSYFISSKNDCCSFIGTFQSVDDDLQGVIICEYNTIWLSADKELQYFSKLLERIGMLWQRFKTRIDREEQITQLHIKNELLEQELKAHVAEKHNIKQFTFDMAHDLKAPLRSIGGFASLLHKRYHAKLDDAAQQYIENIMGGVERFSNTITRLLNFSKANQDQLNLSITDLNIVVDNLLNSISHILEEKEVVVIAKDLPEMTVDAIQIEHLFQNLIENAIKFTPKERSPIIEIEAQEQEEYFEFSVKDNGIGVCKDKIDTIFQPFKRLHAFSEFEGSGMGLSICQKIVQRHNGQIWAESEGEGKGTTFKFKIPKQIEA